MASATDADEEEIEVSEFWMGVIWASGFWVLAYCAAVVCWAIWDVRQERVEMPNTEGGE